MLNFTKSDKEPLKSNATEYNLVTDFHLSESSTYDNINLYAGLLNTEVVEETPLGGDALGVGRLVPQPADSRSAVLSQLRAAPSRLLGETLQLHQDCGGNTDTEVTRLGQVLDVSKVVDKNVGVGNKNFRP